MYCYKCGAENLQPESRFCHMCGTRLITPEVEAYLADFVDPDSAGEQTASLPAAMSSPTPPPATVTAERQIVPSIMPQQNAARPSSVPATSAAVNAASNRTSAPAAKAVEPGSTKKKVRLEKRVPAEGFFLCPKCGAENKQGRHVCFICGAPFENQTSGSPDISAAVDDQSTDSVAASGICCSCGAAVGAEDAFCMQCGTPLTGASTLGARSPQDSTRQEVHLCTACGAACQAGDMFCCNCGAALQDTASAALPKEHRQNEVYRSTSEQ